MAFKMKGHALPGINQKGNGNLKDGRSKSSAFQKDGITGKIYDSKDEADKAHKKLMIKKYLIIILPMKMVIKKLHHLLGIKNKCLNLNK